MMGTVQMTWEDEENNRQVRLTAEYSVASDSLTIRSITPTQVSFLCPTSGDALRTVRVWTDKGRELLARAFRGSDQFDALLTELAEQAGLTAQA